MNEPEWYQHDGSYILVNESKAPLTPAMVTAVAIAILLTLGLWLLLSFGPESFRTRERLEEAESIRASEGSQVVETNAILSKRWENPG